MAPLFTHSHYRRMLEAAKADKRVFPLFTEFDPQEHKRVVILRHDIDLSLSHALELARIEADLGVRATYFIRLNSTFYNPASQRDFPLLQEIVALDHAIGLHFDPQFYRDNGLALLEGIDRECNILSSLVDRPIETVSQHRPVSLGLDRSFEESHYYRFFTYNDRFTKDCKYISESCQQWREGDLIDNLPQHERIQILVHPVWWRPEHRAWQDCLRDVGSGRSGEIRDKAEVLVGRYQHYLETRAQREAQV